MNLSFLRSTPALPVIDCNSPVAQVPFYDNSIEAVRADDGTIMVSLKRVCESLGVSMQGQHEKLSKCEWATVKIILTVAEDGKRRRLTMIDLESLPMWLATINVSKVRIAVRPKLLQYQREARAVLAAWFADVKGSPLNADRPNTRTRHALPLSLPPLPARMAAGACQSGS